MNVDSWLKTFRAKALLEYELREIPGKLARGWRFTDASAFVPRGVPLDRYRPVLTAASVPPEAELLRFGEVSGETETLVRSGLENSLGPDTHKLELLSLSRWQDARILRIPAGVRIEEPVSITLTPGDSEFTSTRLLIIAGEGSSITVFNLLSGGPPAGTPFLVNSAVEILAGEGAAVRFASSQELAEGGVSYLSLRVRAASDSSVSSAIATFGCRQAKVDLESFLEGSGAHSLLVGIAVASGEQSHDHHVFTLHTASATRSDCDFRSVVGDRAQSTVTGLIKIRPEAKGCEAWQGNRNLMLSKEAKANSLPELEIMNNEVKCSHGSATGPVDPGQVYYLMSRGIPREEAARLLTAGFVQPALESVPAPLRELIGARLAGRLETATAASAHAPLDARLETA